MTNRTLGVFVTDVDWRGGGKVRLHLTMNGLCSLEERTGQPFTVFIRAVGESAQAGQLRIADVRSLLWAAMLQHQPDATVQDAGDAMMAMGGLDKVVLLLMDLVRASMPEPAPQGAAVPDPGKRKAAG